MIFRQLFDIKGESSTYTYILADETTKEGVIIDPVIENLDRDAEVIEDLEIKIKYIIDTHIHADHITGAGKLKELLGGETVVGKNANSPSYDIGINDQDELSFGKYSIKALYTPGHTDSCTSFYCNGRVFTGDAMLYRGCGRTDFQQGDAKKLYESVHKQLYSLDINTLVYPAHDYNGRMTSSIEEEKRYNKRLAIGITQEKFVEIMNNLNLVKPKKIDMAVPANMKAGLE